MNLPNRLLTALAVLALAAAPGIAVAKKPSKKSKKPTPRAKVLRAKLAPTTTDAEYAGIAGKAHLVDGKKNDKVTIHVRNLQPGTPYLWHVHEADGDENPCDAGSAGPIVDDFDYKLPKVANAAGNLNAKARSKTFKIDREETYYVNVHAADGTVLACGVLEGKKAKSKKAKNGKSKKAKSKKGAAKKRGATRKGGSRGKAPAARQRPSNGKGKRP